MISAALVLAVTLAGCGEDANDQPSGEPRTAVLAGEGATTTTRADVAMRPPDDDSALAAGGVEAVAASVTATVTPTGVVVPVAALDNSFRPAAVEIAIGDEVVWENRGANEHNVLRVEGEGWGVEVDAFQPGDTYAHVFAEPGEYRYFCSIHGNEDIGMIGTVVVTG